MPNGDGTVSTEKVLKKKTNGGPIETIEVKVLVKVNR